MDVSLIGDSVYIIWVCGICCSFFVLIFFLVDLLIFCDHFYWNLRLAIIKVLCDIKNKLPLALYLLDSTLLHPLLDPSMME